MHVAICSDGIFPAKIGGIQRHTRLLAETMARIRPSLRLTVIHTHPGKTLFPDLANIHELAVEPRPGRRQYLVECLSLSERFAGALRSLPDAVIYSQGICVVRNIREFSTRLVVNPHGLEFFQTTSPIEWVKGIPFRTVQRHTFRHARHVVSLGGHLTRILRRETRNAPDKVVVLPNGVCAPPIEAALRRNRPASAPLTLIFVGRLARNKGVADLLQAMDLIERDGRGADVRLHVVGSGPLLGKLRNSRPRDNVTFHEEVSDSELERLYAEADALVLPTLFEGMPTVVLEAMARGLPVLVTDVGATREMVDGSNGSIIPKQDPEGLASEILKLTDLGHGARCSLGTAGRARVDARFTWQRVAQAHLDLFDRIAAS